ncbi:SRPBCC family protein [Nocardia transvalensis]|uniref:SRPBCC family protein n=1 Tax=Nocardia transvalensis TaxID=37333 RepID=UPI0018932ADC|nr:SRPBCC family protein [Nocardia transvalensis]MBF6331923.1 SRPBCC family protein [Nocardia transvalensis]
MIDILNESEQVRRSVTDQGQTKQVTLTRTYDTSVEDLWDACTNPERLTQWFEPIDGDLREGGRYRLGSSGTSGTIEHCSAPNRLQITWEYEGDVSTVDVVITDNDRRATLSLTHTVPDNEHWRTYGPGAAGVGWDSSFLALGLHLAGDHRAHPTELEKVFATPGGAVHVRRLADSWAEAHTDCGTDSADAHTMADRAVAAYASMQ